MGNQFERTKGLLGEALFQKIQNKTIAVIGLGGVGGTAFEALIRTGFVNFTLVDFDNVDQTNLNRQILYSLEDVGKVKVEAALKRAKAISSSVKATLLPIKIDKDSISKIGHPDFVIDAIDDVKGKVEIAKYCQNYNIPFIVSLGMANRINATDVVLTKLNKTTGDPLARKLRYEYKTAEIDISKFDVVFSKEIPTVSNGKLNSIMTAPSAAGLSIVQNILYYFTISE